MEIVFAITGKAGKNGHEQWRKVNDEDFSTRIYTHSKREANETSRLEIEIREYKDNIFTYYTYLIVKNVAQVKSKEDSEKQEKHGRTGSFFGMTVRVKDGYFSDVSKLYSLFENIFESRIKGTILTDKNTDGYLTYLIEKLDDGEDTFIKAENDFFSAISDLDFQKLPINSVTQQKRVGEVKTKLFNVVDTGRKSFLQSLFNDAEVNVSRDYDTIEQVEIRRKQAELQRKQTEEKKSLPNQFPNNDSSYSGRYSGKRMPSGNIAGGASRLQSQKGATKANTQTIQYAYSNQANNQDNRLLFKFISIFFETSKLLLSFLARQKSIEKSTINENSEFQEYENRLYQLSKELEDLKNQRELMEESCDDNRLTSESSLSIFNLKKFDYRLIIPFGIIFGIILGYFIGMHNSDKVNQEVLNQGDTLQVEGNYLKTQYQDTKPVIPNKNDTTCYTVIDADARLRDTTTADRYTVITVIPQNSIFKGIDSTKINGVMWIKGFDNLGNVGWTKRSNFK